METDDRELRLRANFPFMMVWTALAIGVFGYLLGLLLHTVATTVGIVFGVAPSVSSQAALHVAGHVLVGAAVVVGLVQSYLAPHALPTCHAATSSSTARPAHRLDDHDRRLG